MGRDWEREGMWGVGGGGERGVGGGWGEPGGSLQWGSIDCIIF